MTDSPRFYLPSNYGFEQLLVASRSGRGSQSSEGTAAVTYGNGLKHGSSLLICGHPGALKTSFALSLLRELMREEYSGTPVLYVVSTELDRHRFRDRYQHVGWFNDTPGEVDLVFSQDRVRIITVDQMKMPQPTLGAEELVNEVFIEMQRLETRTHAGDAHDPVFILFDGVTALLKDSRDAGNWRRNFQEILNRLRRDFGDRLGLVLLTGDAAVGAANGIAAAEDAVDIVMRLGVQHIGGGRRSRTLEITRSIGSNLALGDHVWAFLTHENHDRKIAVRSLLKRIRNEQLSLPRRGDASPPPRHSLPGSVGHNPPIWGVATFFPHPTLPAIGVLQHWKPHPNQTVSRKRIATGIPGMDEMLNINSDPEYWARPARQIMASSDEEPTSSLYAGAVTLLLGRSGSGKTIASLQFLLAEADANSSLYINFENRPHRIHQMFPADEATRQKLLRCHTLYRRRADLDIRVLISEIRYIINTNPIRRIVIDGLSDLWNPLQSSEISQLVEDLIVTIRDMDFERRHRENSAGERRIPAENQEALTGNDADRTSDTSEQTSAEPAAPKSLPVTIMVTLELTEDTDHAPLLEQISFAADNVLLLRQITLNEERHKTIQVVKSRGNAPDVNVREIQIRSGTRYPLRVVPGLESYRQLFSGAPTPVRVTLQLAEENEAETNFNRKLTRSLQSRFGYSFQRRAFNRENLDQTLRDLASHVSNRVAQADVTLFSIDEWWVRDLRCQSHQPALETLWEAQHPLMNLTPFLVSMTGATTTSRGAANGNGVNTNRRPSRYTRFPSDYWLTEFEKASINHVPPADADSATHPQPRHETVACPGYLDFGLFCVARNAADRLLQHGRDSSDLIGKVSRCWARFDADGWVRETGDGEPPTLIDQMRELKTAVDLDFGFAFDMETPINAVCTLLELAWSFGASEDFLFSDVVRFHDSPDDPAAIVNQHPLTLALRFLQYLVLEDLMPPVPSLNDTERACFSRHWFSTYQHSAVKELPAGNSTHLHFNAVPLPFQPVGLGHGGVAGALAAAARDIVVRFHRLIGRIRAATEYRAPLLTNTDETDRIRKECDRIHSILEDADQRIAIWLVSPVKFNLTQLADLLALLDESCDELERLSLSSLFDTGVRLELSPPAGSSAADNPETAESDRWQFRTAAQFLDRRDISLMCSWHRLRSRLVHAQLTGRPISPESIGGEASDSRSTDFIPVENQHVTALTGYACEGSWLLGVSRTTHSPALSANIMFESASLEHARKRTEHRAGIPARKDFYQSSGKTPVLGLPPESSINDWQTFLNCLGSRGRRRDRIACPRVATSEIFNRLHIGMMSCLQAVTALRAAGELTPEDRLKDLTTRVVTRVFDEIAGLLASPGTDPAASTHDRQPPQTQPLSIRLTTHAARHCTQPDCQQCRRHLGHPAEEGPQS